MKKTYSLIILIIVCIQIGVANSLQIEPTFKNVNRHYNLANDSVPFSRMHYVKQFVYAGQTDSSNKVLEYIFPIFTLLLGVAIDRILLLISEKKRVKKSGELWIMEIRNLNAPLTNQIESFKYFITSYCDINNAFEMPSIPKYETLKCEIFDSLQKKDLYDYLKNKCKLDYKILFHNILNIISTTKGTYEQTLKEFDKSINVASMNVDSFNNSLQCYIRELYINETKYKKCLKGDFDILLQLINIEIEKKMPYINLFEIQNSFIKESLSIIMKHDKMQCAELLTALMKCQDNIAALKNEKEYCRRNFEQSISLFNIVIDKINSLPLID